MRWKLIVISAGLTCLISFTFLFKYDTIEPMLFGVPYILWVSMMVTTIIVVLTFLGFKNFPYNDKK